MQRLKFARAVKPVLAALGCLALGACGPPLPYAPPPRAPVAPPPSLPPPPVSSGSPETTPLRGVGPARPAPRVSRVQPLGAPAAALVRQSRTEAAKGDFALAAATLERALRIEPDHPLLWLELGNVREAQHNYAQAEVMGRKALAAADDHATQALAWRLIAASLSAQGRARQAAEANERARQLAGDS